MAAPDITSFKLRFPELAGNAGNLDARINFYLADTIAELSVAAWGDRYAKAVELLSAHRLALAMQRSADAQTDGAGNVTVAQQGTIQSASADGLSVSFAGKQSQTSGTVVEEDYSQTPYGVEYMTLRARTLRRGRLASVGNNYP